MRDLSGEVAFQSLEHSKLVAILTCREIPVKGNGLISGDKGYNMKLEI